MLKKSFLDVYHELVWKLAQFGWKLIKLYAKAQHSVDGDFVQVREIVNEWLNELQDYKMKMMFLKISIQYYKFKGLK